MYMGTFYGDYSYLVVLEPGQSITVRQKPDDCSPMADLYTITFDGEQAFQTQHDQPALCQA